MRLIQCNDNRAPGTSDQPIYGRTEMERMALEGPMVVPLPPAYKFNNTEVMEYITGILQRYNAQGAYGILAAVGKSGKEVIPTIVLGIPGRKLVNSDLAKPPSNLGLLIQDNCMLPVAGYDTPWSSEKVRNLEQLDLRACSVGLEG